MEGALVSVVGGLVDVPVIAVPTSIGYGSNLQRTYDFDEYADFLCFWSHRRQY